MRTKVRLNEGQNKNSGPKESNPPQKYGRVTKTILLPTPLSLRLFNRGVVSYQYQFRTKSLRSSKYSPKPEGIPMQLPIFFLLFSLVVVTAQNDGSKELSERGEDRCRKGDLFVQDDCAPNPSRRRVCPASYFPYL